MKRVRLENVIDIRTDKFHSVVIVKENMAKWFVPADEVSESE